MAHKEGISQTQFLRQKNSVVDHTLATQSITLQTTQITVGKGRAVKRGEAAGVGNVFQA